MPKSRIVRYRFENNLGPRELQLPVDAKIVAAGHFNGAPALWVRVPDTEPGETLFEVWRFFLTTTGQTIEEELGRLIGTSIATGHEILIFELESDAEASISLEERLEAVGSDARDMIDAFRGRLEGIESPTGVSIPDLDRALDIVTERQVALTDELEAIRVRVEAVERRVSTLGGEIDSNLEDLGRELRPRLDELERRLPS